MENVTEALEQFKVFAAGRSDNHIAELNTRYQNEKIDKETLEKAYSEHKEIFSQELDEKIKELNAGQNNEWLNTELQNQKSDYLNQLDFPQ